MGFLDREGMVERMFYFGEVNIYNINNRKFKKEFFLLEEGRGVRGEKKEGMR